MQRLPLCAPRPARPPSPAEAASPEAGLGSLGRLPRHLLTKHILPEAAENTFVPGLAGASTAARAVVIEAAQCVLVGYAQQQALAAYAALGPRPASPQPTRHWFELHRQASRFLASTNASSCLHEAQRAQESGDAFGALRRLADAKNVWPQELRVHRAFVELAYSTCQRYHLYISDILAPWQEKLFFTDGELMEVHTWVAQFKRWDGQLGGLLEGAMQSYEVLLSHDAHALEPLLHLGELLCWQHRHKGHRGLAPADTDPTYEDILPYFERALRLRPHWADAHLGLARCHHQFGKLDEAVAAYERALMYGLGPEPMAQAHLACGEIFERLGHKKQALARHLFVVHHVGPPYQRRSAWRLQRLRSVDDV